MSHTQLRPGKKAGGRSGWQANRVEGAGAVTTSDEVGTTGKVVNYESPGLELNRAVVVTSEVMHREEGMNQIGYNKDVVEVERS
jgi:hypothetical protein